MKPFKKVTLQFAILPNVTYITKPNHRYSPTPLEMILGLMTNDYKIEHVDMVDLHSGKPIIMDKDNFNARLAVEFPDGYLEKSKD